MSLNLGEANVDGHPETAAYMVIRNEAGEFVFVQGVTDGDFAAQKVVAAGGLGGGRKITAKTDISVTNNVITDFVLNLDSDGSALPSDLEIQAILIQPHNGADPPVAVSTKWRFTLYTHSGREIDDVFYERDRTGDAASNELFGLNVKWGYFNEEGNGEIPCSLFIADGENDSVFTVKIIFA